MLFSTSILLLAANVNKGKILWSVLPYQGDLAVRLSERDVLQFTRDFFSFVDLKTVTGSLSESSLPEILIAFFSLSVKNDEIKQATTNKRFLLFFLIFGANYQHTYVNAASTLT